MKRLRQTLTKQLLLRTLKGLTVLLCFGSVSVIIGKVHWLLDLATHFQVQYFIGLFVVGVIFAVLKQKRWVAICLIFFLFNAALITPLYVAHKLPATHEENLRVLFFNILYKNKEYDKLEQLLVQEQPDVVVMAETNEIIHQTLQERLPEYKYAYFKDGRGAFGITVMTKEKPVGDVSFYYFGDTPYPSIRVQMELSGETISIIGTHPYPPIYPQGALNRNQALRGMAKEITKMPGPIVAVGDFNSTSWSPYFKEVLNTTGLRDSRIGFGINPSWPSKLPSFLRIPIDHILVSDEIVVVTRYVLGDYGSDHRPILADLRIKQK